MDSHADTVLLKTYFTFFGINLHNKKEMLCSNDAKFCHWSEGTAFIVCLGNNWEFNY